MKKENRTNAIFVIQLLHRIQFASFTTKDTFYQFIKERKPYKCNTCYSTFANKSNLHKHVAIIHGREKPFQCNVCDASFTLNPSLKNTFYQFMKKGNLTTGIFHICDLTFADKSNLNLVNIHVKEKVFKCITCDTSFSLKCEKKLRRVLDACFLQKSYLNQHVTSIHDGKKFFRCIIFDTSFTKKNNLNKHIASVHENKKNPLIARPVTSTLKQNKT